MSLRRHLNAEGVKHADADSLTHSRHQRQRQEQRALEWIPESAAENPAQEFKLNADELSLSQGLYCIGYGAEELHASGEAFQAHCNSVNWSRRWNSAPMKRGDKMSTVRRKRSSPACEELVVNLSPWQMKFINRELELWKEAGLSPEERRPLLLGWIQELRKDVVKEFKEATGRDVIGSYIHLDSNKVHLGVIHSRVGADNSLVGEKSLGTVGPWSTAQNRISKLGLLDAGDKRLQENLEKFGSRFGSRVPLDIRLHDTLDARFDELVARLGQDAGKRYEASIEYYRSWKIKTRREAVNHSPASQRVVFQTLRLVAPLLPAPIRSALALSRTATQAISVIGTAVDALGPSLSSPTHHPQQNLL